MCIPAFAFSRVSWSSIAGAFGPDARRAKADRS
jgi:hypothetical protein